MDIRGSLVHEGRRFVGVAAPLVFKSAAELIQHARG